MTLLYLLRLELYLPLILLLFFPFIPPLGEDGSQLEWEVDVGYSITQELVNYYDPADSDRDGNINSFTFLVTDKTGKLVNITWFIGSRVKSTITRLRNDTSTAYVERSYDGLLTEEVVSTGIVQRTVNNRSYWEEYAQSITGENQSASVEGRLLIVEKNISLTNITFTRIVKFDWTTGWYIYYFTTEFNDTATLSIMEVSIVTTHISGFNFPFFQSSLLVIVFFLRKADFRSD